MASWMHLPEYRVEAGFILGSPPLRKRGAAIEPGTPVPMTPRAVEESIRAVETVVVDANGSFRRRDWLAAEEPLEIRAIGPDQDVAVSVAVTMRTPGRDDELAVGFLHAEGILRTRADLVAVGRCRSKSNRTACNIIRVALAHPFDDARVKRNFIANSGCGLCGKVALDQIAVRCAPIPKGLIVSKSVVLSLPDALRNAQTAFDRTGGLHAAGLFDLVGTPIVIREDVGRHNAVDKVVGRQFLDDELPLSARILLVSGRSSFEILQKAAVARVPVVAAVSAPSSLAVNLAERLGITLIGFLRGRGFNIYSHPERIDLQG